MKDKDLIGIFINSEVQKEKEEAFEELYRSYDLKRTEDILYKRFPNYSKIMKVIEYFSGLDDLRNDLFYAFTRKVAMSGFDGKEFNSWFSDNLETAVLHLIRDNIDSIYNNLQEFIEVFLNLSLRTFIRISNELPFFYLMLIEIYLRLIEIFGELENHEQRNCIILYLVFTFNTEDIDKMFPIRKKKRNSSSVEHLKKAIYYVISAMNRDLIGQLFDFLHSAEIMGEVDIQNLDIEEKKLYNLRLGTHSDYKKISEILSKERKELVTQFNHIMAQLLSCSNKVTQDPVMNRSDLDSFIKNLNFTKSHKEEFGHFKPGYYWALLRNLFFVEEKYQGHKTIFEIFLTDEKTREEFKTIFKKTEKEIQQIISGELVLADDQTNEMFKFFGLPKGYLRSQDRENIRN